MGGVGCLVHNDRKAVPRQTWRVRVMFLRLTHLESEKWIPDMDHFCRDPSGRVSKKGPTVGVVNGHPESPLRGYQ